MSDGSVGSVRSIYTGTTGHSLHKRMGEHMDSLRLRNGVSALSKHQKSMHPNLSDSESANLFSARILRGNYKLNTCRFIDESLNIEKLNSNPSVMLLNSKSEWNKNRVSRLRKSNG